MTRVIDLSAGFFGWFAFGNLIILVLGFLILEASINLDAIVLSYINQSLTLIAVVVLLARRKYWLCAGITSALIINLCLCLLLHSVIFSNVFDVGLPFFLLWYAGFPLPMALVVMLFTSG